MGKNRKKTWIWVSLGGLLLSIGLLTALSFPRWREAAVFQALSSPNPPAPAFWWPSDWRRELNTSFLLEGQVYQWDAELRRAVEEHRAGPGQSAFGHPVTSGTLELVPEADGRVFRTAVNAKGGYSFGRQRLPAVPFKIRLLTPEGSASGWLQMGALDPGLHRLNWSF